MKKHFWIILFLFGCQLSIAQIKLEWDTHPSTTTQLNETLCDPQVYILYFEWDSGSDVLKADTSANSDDYDEVTLSLKEEISGQWTTLQNVGGTGVVLNTKQVNSGSPYGGIYGVFSGTSSGTRKFKLFVTKKNFVPVKGGGYTSTIYSQTESAPYILKVTMKPLQVSCKLKAGTQLLNSNASFSATNVVCDHDLILTNITSSCAKEFRINIEEYNSNGQSLGVIHTSGILSSSILSPSINLNTFFNGLIQKDKLYRINLRVKKGNNWTSVNSNVFFINYHQSKNPTISINTPKDICIGTPVTITLSDPPNNFQWTSTSGTLPTGISSTITPTQSGLYNITSSDYCVNLPYDLELNVNPLPTIDLSQNPAVHCANVHNLVHFSAITNPTGGTGNWSINTGSISSTGVFNPTLNFIPANFVATYTYTDPNGCTDSEDFSFTYYNPSTFTTNVNHLSCYGANDGEIFPVATGYPPYNYTLNGNSLPPGFSGLAAGTHQVALTDGHNCVSTKSIVITQPQALTASLSLPSPQNLSCYGTGVYVQVNNVQGGTGTYSYDFGNGFSSNYGQLLYPKASPYQIRVKDQNGCIKTFSFQVNGPSAPISVTPSSTDPYCNGQSNGTISLSVSNAVAPLSITWNNGMSGANLSNLSAGTYAYTIVDANGCHKTGTVTLNYQNPTGDISVNPSITHSACLGTNGGSIHLSAPTNANYSYAWSTGSNNNNIVNLVSGNYNVTITNNTAPFSGCKVVKHYGINDNNTSNWHKNTQNTVSQEDKIIKVITDAQNNVYALGEFIGSSQIDGQSFQANNNNSNQKGIFVSKHDACGQLRWVDYTNSTSTIDIKGLEIEFDGTEHLRVFGQLENQGTANFDVQSSNGSNITLAPTGNNDVFSVRIRKGTGALSAPITYAIPYTDKVNAVDIDNNTHYFAGNFGGFAQVKKQINNNLTVVFGETNASGNNEMSSIAVDGADIYATANLNTSTNFNGTTIISNGKEGVLFHYNNGALSWNNANAEQITLNDILIASNNTIWVAGSLAGPMNWGNNLVAKYQTAIVCEFNSSLTNNNVFYIDDKNSVFSTAAAIALSERNGQLYAAGTYVGQTIGMKQVSNPNNLVQVSGGLNNHAAMWLASLNLTSTASINWINNSYSNQPIQVYDVATDGFNSYVVGNYKDNIQLPPSSNLSNPTNGSLNLGYIIRGGDAYGQPVFYKPASSNIITNTQTALSEQTTVNNPTNSSIYQSLLEVDKLNVSTSSYLKLFPNPNKGYFTVQIEAPETGKIHLSITDVSGKIIHQQIATKTTPITTLDVRPMHLPQGAYILHITHNGHQQHQKFLVQ
ncbi:T9SS type A sorting domain-containing protein [Aureispira sp. CCB-E]|uniref:T9SS type A sorting domain-containing protein n=1 Tax=Aureispira sp. CCB-E TaxID=3051121 RepID=UPI002869017D|nr:T9SS type A sorting domain-containing protein [Aureispira sp. CCB-E]WMX14898.1 T9SS type A sorting domain-containing protein [Aureispira sp. CCB-E]